MKLLVFLLSLLAVSLEAAVITNWGAQLPTAVPAGGDVILMQKGGVTYYFTPNQLASSLATNANLNASNKIANLDGQGTNMAHYGSLNFQRGGATNLTDLRFYQTVSPVPPVATLIAAAGNINDGTHVYRITFVTAVGETEQSLISNTVSNNAANGQTSVTLPVSSDPSVTSRRLYRTKANDPVIDDITLVYLVTNILDNTTAVFTDNRADSTLGTMTYGILDNTTGGNLWVNGVKAGTIGHRWSTAFGYGVLDNNVGGGGNTAFGAYVLNQNTEGRLNQGFGYLVLRDNTVGSFNSGYGDVSLTHNINGVGNAGYGYQTLRDNTSGSYNSAYGFASMERHQNGVANVAAGVYSMYLHRNGSNNVGIGGEVLYTGTNSASQTAVGFGALGLGVTGYRNAALGEYAGRNTKGEYGTYIGALAGYTGSSVTGNVMVGAAAGYYETASDKLFIDNRPRSNEADARTNTLVYGVFANAQSNQVFAINGFVGINNIAPSLPFYVRGKVDAAAFTGVRIDNPGAGSGTAARLSFSDSLGNDNDHAWVQGAYDGTGMNVQIGTGAGWIQGTAKMTIAHNGVVTLAGTTNHIVFGSTNIAPSSAVAPTKWVSVQVAGDAGVYRIPLYE